jgi:ribosomal protein S12 methylthiotransferase
VVARRVARTTELIEELVTQRAEERLGTLVDVLVDTTGDEVEGRAAHQAPEIDGSTTLVAVSSGGPGDGGPTEAGAADGGPALADLRPGDLVRAKVVASSGVDLVAVPVEVLDRAGPAGASNPPAAGAVFGSTR